jgi:hypothetical protein
LGRLQDGADVFGQKHHTIAQNPARAKPAGEVTHMSFRPFETVSQLLGRGDFWEAHFPSSLLRPGFAALRPAQPTALRKAASRRVEAETGGVAGSSAARTDCS